MTGLFNSLQIPDVEKVVIENNEFTLKHQLLIERPTQHFLLYQAKAKPIDNETGCWICSYQTTNFIQKHLHSTCKTLTCRRTLNRWFSSTKSSLPMKNASQH